MHKALQREKKKPGFIRFRGLIQDFPCDQTETPGVSTTLNTPSHDNTVDAAPGGDDWLEGGWCWEEEGSPPRLVEREGPSICRHRWRFVRSRERSGVRVFFPKQSWHFRTGDVDLLMFFFSFMEVIDVVCVRAAWWSRQRNVLHSTTQHVARD